MKRLLLLAITLTYLSSCDLFTDEREINRIFRQKYGSKPDFAFRVDENKILGIKKAEGSVI